MLRDSAAPGVGASAGHTRTRDSALGTSGLAGKPLAPRGPSPRWKARRRVPSPDVPMSREQSARNRTEIAHRGIRFEKAGQEPRDVRDRERDPGQIALHGHTLYPVSYTHLTLPTSD